MATPLHRPLLGRFALSLATAGVLLPASAHAADPVDTTTCHGKVVTQVVRSSETATATGSAGDDVIVVVVDRASAIALDAQAGNDTVCITGFTGFATVDAGDGDDVVSAAAVTTYAQSIVPNTVLLGAGNDTFVGSAFPDLVRDTGAPISGDDTIDTADGNDRVFLSSGTDQVTLGAGVDSLVVEGTVSGSWTGGVGADVYNLLVVDSHVSATSKNAPRADVDLAAGTFRLGDAAAGAVTGFTSVTVRGFGRARVTGSGLPDQLEVRACRTVLDAGAGNDLVDLDSYRKCASSSSKAHGGAGQDTVRGAKGNDRLYGDGGRDRLFGRGGADLLDGGGANDKLIGGPGRDILRGGGGKDTLTGNRGFDVAFGGNGRDTCSAERRVSC